MFIISDALEGVNIEEKKYFKEKRGAGC